MTREIDSSAIEEHLESHPKRDLILAHAPAAWEQYNPAGATLTFYLIDRKGSILLTGTGSSALEALPAAVSLARPSRR